MVEVAPRLFDQARLQALEVSDLLDTQPEAVFDRAVELANDVLGTPVGLLSLVDGKRQFFKAQAGLPEPYSTRRQTPLSHSFCQYVVGTDAPLSVRDAREDPVLKDNLAIPDLSVIAYLGVPVHDDQGQVLGSFCTIDSEPRDWTERDLRVLQNIAVGVESEIALRAELRRRLEAEGVSRRAEERLTLAVRAGRMGTFDFNPRTGKTVWDHAMYELWWIDPSVEDPSSIAKSRIHRQDREVYDAALAAALDPAKTGRHKTEVRILHPETGDIRWIHLDGEVTFEGDAPVRIVGIARDITSRREVERHNALLTTELNHRVKNLFAITAGMVGLTAKTSDTPSDMARVLRGRISALAKAHELIQPAIVGTQDASNETDLKQLLDAILAPHLGRENSGKMSGPQINLGPRAAASLALVFHELATNASKYGALAEATGELSVSWTVKAASEDFETLEVSWMEVGGPDRDEATPSGGFGSTLIHMTIGGQMAGYWERSWTPSGLLVTLSVPVSSLRN